MEAPSIIRQTEAYARQAADDESHPIGVVSCCLTCGHLDDLLRCGVDQHEIEAEEFCNLWQS